MAVSMHVLKDHITLIAKKTKGPPKISYNWLFQDSEEVVLVSLNYSIVKDSNVDLEVFHNGRFSFELVQDNFVMGFQLLLYFIYHKFSCFNNKDSCQ